jgi:hypothetical protein
MSTIAQHISTLRKLTKLSSSEYSDEFFYGLMKDGRNHVIFNEEKYDKELDIYKTRLKNNNEFEWYYNTYCVPLEAGKSHTCNCESVGCDVLKSKFKLPKISTYPNKTSSKSLLRVYTLGNKKIPYIHQNDLEDLKYDETKINKLAFSVIDNYLVIWNNTKLKAVQVSGIWEDPIEWADIQLCIPKVNSEDSDVDETNDPDATCFSIDNDEFNIKSDHVFSMYKYVLDLLNIPIQIKTDTTHDNNSNIVL